MKDETTAAGIGALVGIWLAALTWTISTVLTIIFVILQLTNNIAWSYWWVFAPLWASFALTVVLAIFGGILGRLFSDKFTGADVGG